MFLNIPGKPTPIKKTAYLCATVFLGVLLGLIVQAMMEIKYLDYAQSRGLEVNFYYGNATPPSLVLSLVLAGAVIGYFLGQYWWRKVYIERNWAKSKGKK
jgi:H+/Cl- antiporter ClcA